MSDSATLAMVKRPVCHRPRLMTIRSPFGGGDSFSVAASNARVCAATGTTHTTARMRARIDIETPSAAEMFPLARCTRIGHLKRPSLTTWILLALVAGILFGAALPGPAVKLAILGTI